MSTIRLGFDVIKNNGRESRYSQKCILISILDWLRIRNDDGGLLKRYGLEDLYRLVGRFPGKDNDIWNIERSGHIEYIESICEILNIEIHIYYANYDKKKGSYWIGNSPSHIYGNRKDVKIVAIIAWGMHFELIISRTPTTSELIVPLNMTNRVKRYPYDEKTKEPKVVKKMIERVDIIDNRRMHDIVKNNQLMRNRMVLRRTV